MSNVANQPDSSEQNDQNRRKEIESTRENNGQYPYCNDPCYCKMRRRFWRIVGHNIRDRNFWIAVGTWALAIIGYFGLHWASQDTREATIEANRAWLSVSWGKDNFVAPNFIIGVTIANTGRDPATDANLTQPIVSFPYLNGDPLADKSFTWPSVDTCKGVRPVRHGLTVFPAPADVKQELISKAATPEDLSWVRGLRDGSRGMFVIGCIAYTTFNAPHHTQYCFLERKMPDNTITGTNCKIGGYAD